jgi:hypothetical protein
MSSLTLILPIVALLLVCGVAWHDRSAGGL